MGLLDQGIGGLWSFFAVLLPFLFVLTVVVFVHELGHFLVARWAGVKIKAFSIGFGREIFGFYDRRGTRWRFAWIPLGVHMVEIATLLAYGKAKANNPQHVTCWLASTAGSPKALTPPTCRRPGRCWRSWGDSLGENRCEV